MAPVAFILGGFFGTFSAVFSWLIFGISFVGMIQIYFFVGLSVAALITLFALRAPRASSDRQATVDQAGMQRA